MFRRYQHVIRDLRAHDPELPVVLLAIKPSEFFARNRADQEQLNRRLRDWAASYQVAINKAFNIALRP
jgi:hypothetical protein